MQVGFLVKGFIIGFSIAAPVGPIGVLCIRRTLTNSRKSGFISGLGAATADGLYGAVAAFGLTFISNILVSQQLWLRLVGGIFLLYLGLKTFLSKPVKSVVEERRNNLLGDYVSTFFLTITNPTTILSFGAIFIGLGLIGTTGDYISATLLVLGITLGSTFWWFILSWGINSLRSRLNHYGLEWINRASGLIIITFGVVALIGALKKLL